MHTSGLALYILSLPLAATDATQWVIYAMMALAIIYLIARPMRRRKDPLEKPPGLSLAGQRAVERQMSDLLVELSEMARRISAQLDTRSQKLELLIHDADQRIAELRQLAGQHPAPRRDGQLRQTSPSPAPSPSATEVHDDRYSAIYDLADQGRTPQQIAHELDRPQGEVELILALRR